MIFNQMKVAIEPLLPRIYQHPFNLGLAQGNLPESTFNFFIRQDALYVRDFSRALFLVSQRSEQREQAQFLKHLGEKTLRFEQEIQREYLSRADRIKPQASRLFAWPVKPYARIPAVCNYSQYLLDTAQQAPIAVSVASLLPCFWLYNQLGKSMQASPGYQPQNPYYRWIQSYSRLSFSTNTCLILGLAEDLSYHSTSELRQRMITAFVKSTEYEVSFWDSVYYQGEPQHERSHRIQPYRKVF